jgi:hypothetical protein
MFVFYFDIHDTCFWFEDIGLGSMGEMFVFSYGLF